MDPPQYLRDDLRDIALVFGHSLVGKVAVLDVGDQLKFEATLLDLGKR